MSNISTDENNRINVQKKWYSEFNTDLFSAPSRLLPVIVLGSEPLTLQQETELKTLGVVARTIIGIYFTADCTPQQIIQLVQLSFVSEVRETQLQSTKEEWRHKINASIDFDQSHITQLFSIIFRTREVITDIERKALENLGVDISSNMGTIVAGRATLWTICAIAQLRFVVSIENDNHTVISGKK